MTITQIAVTAKLVIAAGAISVGAMVLGAPAADADDGVIDQAGTTVEQPPTAVTGEETTGAERRAVVRIINKNPRVHIRR